MAASASISAASVALNSAFGNLGNKLSNMGRKDKVNEWTKGNYGTPVVLPFNATSIDMDLAAGVNFEVTLTGNSTLGLPTNIKAGQSGIITVMQDGTGGRTLAFNSIFSFTAGTAFALTTAAWSTDELCYYVKRDDEIVLTRIADVR